MQVYQHEMSKVITADKSNDLSLEKMATDRYFKHNGRQNTGMPDIVQGLGLPSHLSALATVS